METYTNFKKSLIKNYLLGSFLTIGGIFVGVNIASLQIGLHDMLIILGILVISALCMSFFEYVSFKTYIQPIREALLHPKPTLNKLEEAYYQCHRCPCLSGFRILGPRFIGVSIPAVVLMLLAINLNIIQVPYIYIVFATLGTIIFIGVHAMVEFYLTSHSIEPVIDHLKTLAYDRYHQRLTLNGKMIVSLKTKFLMSSFLIGTFPLILFSLAIHVQLNHLTPEISERYWIWGGISLVLSISLASYGAWLLFSYMTKPLKELHEKMKQVQQGNYDVVASDYYSDEFSKVVSGFNQMVKGLQEKETSNQLLIESFFETLATVLDAKDTYTAGHSIRVATFSVEIGLKLGLSEEQLLILRKSALLHDIGKIGVPDEILLKKGSLTEQEMKQIQRHCAIGEDIMKKMKPKDTIIPILPGIRSHHERFDGKGYPDQLHGKEIPLNGRIIAVADAYDAMTSNRPYRLGLTTKKAVEILESGKNTQWDAEIVDSFVNLLKEQHILFETHTHNSGLNEVI